MSGCLAVPGTMTNLGSRNFAVAGAKVWNSLPVDLRLLSRSHRTFGHKLKHYLFVSEPWAHLRFFKVALYKFSHYYYYYYYPLLHLASNRNFCCQCIWFVIDASKSAILFYSILFYFILFHSIPFHSIPFHSIPFYPILSYSILFYSILFYTSEAAKKYNQTITRIDKS